MKIVHRPASTFPSILLAILACVLAACEFNKQRLRDEHARAAMSGERGITVYAAGDIADCRKSAPENSGAARTAALLVPLLAADKNAVVLGLGDHTYPIGLLSEFTECYDPTWGQFKDRTFPAPGNHEYYSPNAAGYYSYFGAAAGPDRRGYYSFRLGSWHVISLNSYLKPEQHKAQIAWLKWELELNEAKCTLAFWHHPLYSSGGHGSITRMKDAWEVLHAANAEIVLSAHDHDYERFAPQDSEGNEDPRGMRQFVVGTGGAKLTPFRFRKWNSETSDNLHHGVLKLVLREVGYEWEFLSVDKGGFVDKGAELCH